MPDGSRALSMLTSSLLVLAVVGSAGALAWAAELGPEPPPARSGPTPGDDGRHRRAPGAPLRLAGSGSNLPLMRLLQPALEAAEPGVRLSLAPSIGSSGGLRALRDGVIDVALVSRAVPAEELGGALRRVAYARTAVVLAAHREVAGDGLSLEALLDALGEHPRSMPGEAAPLVPILREPGDSSVDAVTARLPDLAPAYAAAWERGELPGRLTDQAMEQALSSIPRAIGFFDLGIIRARALPLRVLALDGIEPTERAVARGEYPFMKELALVVPREPAPEVARLIAWLVGPDAQRIIAEHGYQPLAAVSP